MLLWILVPLVLAVAMIVVIGRRGSRGSNTLDARPAEQTRGSGSMAANYTERATRIG